MGEYSTNIEASDLDKDKLIYLLTEELPVLRAKVGLSQDALSRIIGISRQTYLNQEYLLRVNALLGLLEKYQ